MANIPSGLGTVQDLIKRFQKAQERWESWRSIHQEAYDYSNPGRETFRQHAQGQRKNRHVFDSTAIYGCSQFASRIQASLVPSWQNWCMLESGNSIPEEDRPRTDKLLEETTDVMFGHLNHSNFSTEITPGLTDLSIGTGAIMIEEGRFESGKLLRFTNVPLSECFPEMPPSGSIESVWRKQEMEARHITRVWPGADLPQKLQNIVKDQPNRKVTILNGMLYGPDTGKYHQVVIHEGCKHVIFSQDFATKRLIVFRWHVTPGEVFGRGPIIQMLPDIRTVNKVKQFILENAAIQMAGIYTGVDDGVFNPHTVRISPGTVVPVTSNNSQNPTLSALPRAGDIGLGSVILEDLQNNIRKALFSDPLGEVTDPVRSATENLIRQQEMLKQAGASIGRLKSELVEPLVAAIVDILQSRGEIAQIKVDGREVTIRQTSPLAKAEDLEDFQNSQVWWSNVSQLPEAVAMGAAKIENLPAYWGEKLGIPEALQRDEQERQEMGKALMQAAQQYGGGDGSTPV